MANGLKIVDKGWNRIKREVQARQNRVTVGVQGESGSRAVLVATWNEFGTRRADDTIGTPARSFIRSAIDENRGAIVKFAATLFDDFLEHGGDINVKLGQLGEFTKRLIQKKIREGGTPYKKNADSTIAKKGSTHPLIDTGAMLQSIQWKIGDAE